MKKKRSKEYKGNSELFVRFANNEYATLIPPTTTSKIEKRFVDKRLHDTSDIPEIRKKIRKLLDGIIENQKIVDTDELKYFTKVLEQSTPEYRVKDGKLIKEWKPSRTGIEYLFYPIWLRRLAEDLIDYLSNSDVDVRKIKKCPYCNKFFIANKRIKIRRFCRDKHRLAWHNRERIKSGKAKEYKRQKRLEGAKESYYG